MDKENREKSCQVTYAKAQVGGGATGFRVCTLNPYTIAPLKKHLVSTIVQWTSTMLGRQPLECQAKQARI